MLFSFCRISSIANCPLLSVSGDFFAKYKFKKNPEMSVKQSRQNQGREVNISANSGKVSSKALIHAFRPGVQFARIVKRVRASGLAGPCIRLIAATPLIEHKLFLFGIGGGFLRFQPLQVGWSILVIRAVCFDAIPGGWRYRRYRGVWSREGIRS